MKVASCIIIVISNNYHDCFLIAIYIGMMWVWRMFIHIGHQGGGGGGGGGDCGCASLLSLYSIICLD